MAQISPKCLGHGLANHYSLKLAHKSINTRQHHVCRSDNGKASTSVSSINASAAGAQAQERRTAAAPTAPDTTALQKPSTVNIIDINASGQVAPSKTAQLSGSSNETVANQQTRPGTNPQHNAKASQRIEDEYETEYETEFETVTEEVEVSGKAVPEAATTDAPWHGKLFKVGSMTMPIISMHPTHATWHAHPWQLSESESCTVRSESALPSLTVASIAWCRAGPVTHGAPHAACLHHHLNPIEEIACPWVTM